MTPAERRASNGAGIVWHLALIVLDWDERLRRGRQRGPLMWADESGRGRSSAAARLHFGSVAARISPNLQADMESRHFSETFYQDARVSRHETSQDIKDYVETRLRRS